MSPPPDRIIPRTKIVSRNAIPFRRVFEIENVAKRNYSPEGEIIRRIRVRPFLIRLIRRTFVAGPETFQRGRPLSRFSSLLREPLPLPRWQIFSGC